MKIELFVFILLLICGIIIFYFKFTHPNMTYLKSEVDGVFYLVRNTDNKYQAANTLAKIRHNFIKLSDNLYTNMNDSKNIKYKQYIQILHEKVRNIIILESTQDSVYTSYSINKGEQIVFCLRPRLMQNNLHDINLMMYVVLHEISHVACPIYDNHGPLFKEIFAFITKSAIELNIYKKIDFKTNPENYCGLMITDSII